MSFTTWEQRQVVLVVDDEPAIRDLCTAILERSGYSVLVAKNGRDGLNVYREKEDEVAVVVSDLMMAAGDGAEMARDILELNPKARIVLMTGHGMAAGISEDLRSACILLDKPFRPDQLASTVERACR